MSYQILAQGVCSLSSVRSACLSSFDQTNCLLQSSVTVGLLRTARTSDDNFSVVVFDVDFSKRS